MKGEWKKRGYHGNTMRYHDMTLYIMRDAFPHHVMTLLDEVGHFWQTVHSERVKLCVHADVTGSGKLT